MTIEHRAHCAEAQTNVFRGPERGDLIERCITCRRWTVLDEPEQPEQSEPQTERRPKRAAAARTADPARYQIPCARCGSRLPHPTGRPAVRLCGGCKPQPRRPRPAPRAESRA